MKIIYPFKYSFRLVRPVKHRKFFVDSAVYKQDEKVKIQIADENSVRDRKRRMFLRVLGGVSLGVFGASMFPKKADALIMGGTPSTGVVNLRDQNNNKINPAKEDGNLATLAGKDFATQTTVATLAKETGGNIEAIKTDLDKFKFTGENLKVTSSIDSSSAIGIKDAAGTAISPTTEESIVLLRRIVKQVDSLGVVDSAQRQRITLDAITGSLTLATVTAVGTVTTVTSATALGGVDARYLYIDTARNAYSNSIRQNLTWT